MPILNPIVSKFNLAVGVATEVYYCPPGKTDAILDLTFFKDNITTDTIIGVALSTESNVANLTTVDYFIDDIQLLGTVNTGELNKVIVGSGYRLYVKVLSGVSTNVRVTGVEENNSKVLKAGRLAAGTLATTNQTQVYNTTLSNVAYVAGTVTIFNTSTSVQATVNAWITSTATPTASDKILNIVVGTKSTVLLENILLAPDEKVFIETDQTGLEYFFLGTVIGS